MKDKDLQPSWIVSALPNPHGDDYIVGVGIDDGGFVLLAPRYGGENGALEYWEFQAFIPPKVFQAMVHLDKLAFGKYSNNE